MELRNIVFQLRDYRYEHLAKHEIAKGCAGGLTMQLSR